MNGIHRESAVSEVISTVLVVALTVILAALIAAYMFGMIPTMPVSRTLAYTAEMPNSNLVNIVYHGGPDTGTLQFSRVTLTQHGASMSIIPTYKNSTGANSNIFGRDVGSMMTIVPSAGGYFVRGQEHLVITAHFDNNQEQVVLDTFI